MVLYAPSAVERMMRVQEVILRALGGEISWLRAADVIGVTPRTMRRWRARYERAGYDGLFDRRRGRPSPKRVPMEEVARILRLYRERYDGFNVRHFHEIAVLDHGVRLSYTFVKEALQGAGLVKRKRKRGRHFKKRERRACFGEMLHLDGSPHEWLALCPGLVLCLIVVVDDATGEVLHARLWPSETAGAVFFALRAVVERHGIPMALYTDRAGWAFCTPKAGGLVDRSKPTQVGRALARLGVEHIAAYSPQARGRSERMNRTLQDRLVSELKEAGIAGVEAANRFIAETFLPALNDRFRKVPREEASAFVSVGGIDLEEILCHQAERTVAMDNTVVLQGVRMQIEPQPGRRSCAKAKVIVRRHLDGTHSVWRGEQLWGRYDGKGRLLAAAEERGLRATPSAPSPRNVNRTLHLSN
jgi:transposase